MSSIPWLISRARSSSRQPACSPCPFPPYGPPASIRSRRSEKTECGVWLLLPESLILFADELDQLLIEHQLLVHAHRPRFRVRLLVVDGDVDFHLAERWAADSLGDLGGVGHRRANDVEPSV